MKERKRVPFYETPYTLLQFFKERDLIVSPEKSTVYSCLLFNLINEWNIRRFWSTKQLFPLRNNREFSVWPMIRC